MWVHGVLGKSCPLFAVGLGWMWRTGSDSRTTFIAEYRRTDGSARSEHGREFAPDRARLDDV
jgi:hypothetical protein